MDFGAGRTHGYAEAVLTTAALTRGQGRQGSQTKFAPKRAAAVKADREDEPVPLPEDPPHAVDIRV